MVFVFNAQLVGFLWLRFSVFFFITFDHCTAVSNISPANQWIMISWHDIQWKSSSVRSESFYGDKSASDVFAKRKTENWRQFGSRKLWPWVIVVWPFQGRSALKMSSMSRKDWIHSLIKRIEQNIHGSITTSDVEPKLCWRIRNRW